jgi:hypothetical protein
MLGLRLSKGGYGVLRIMTLAFQIDYQCFLPGDVSLALCNVTLCLGLGALTVLIGLSSREVLKSIR